MKKITMVKILLDIIMTVVLVLLYNKRVLGGMEFHEIAGLILGGVFIIHIALNGRWVKQVTLNLFSGKMSIKTRIGYLVDILLLISMAYIIFSGMMISKVIFPNLGAGNEGVFKLTHISVSYLALLLVGIHLGLHWDWVMNTFKRIFKITETKKALSYVAKAAMVVVLVFGIYSINTTNYFSRLSMLTSAVSGGQGANMERGAKGTAPSGEAVGQMQGRPSSAAGGQTGSSEMKGAPNGMEGMKGAPNGMEASSVNPLNVIVTNVGIIGVFTIVTYYIEKLLVRMKPGRKVTELKKA